MHRSAVVLVAFSLTGCISVEVTREGAAPPSYAPIAGAPVSARARLYVECIHQAIEAQTYDHVRDDGSELIRFSCQGTPARAFYDALGPRSVAIGSQFADGRRTWRSTNVIQTDLFGADYCWNEGERFGCDLYFNAGEFLAD